MYMTPQQWARMSEWSASLATQHATGNGDAPWLHLEHATRTTQECIATIGVTCKPDSDKAISDACAGMSWLEQPMARMRPVWTG